jgi:Ca2+-binding EF-hand superfamily protein
MLLPDKSGVWDTTELDLSRSYVGHRGVVPLTELCKLLHKLQKLNLSNNFLTNKSVWHVCKMAAFHPSLSSIDLSKNDVSWTAGMCVLELVSRNPVISAVDISHTLIKPAVADGISAQIRRNSLAGSRHHRRGPKSTNHPLVIRQRALKRFFREALARDSTSDSRLPRSFLAEGYKEMLRLSGREKEVDQRSPNFFTAFVNRCPSETIDWELFMLLVMIEEPAVDSALIEKLRKVFDDFDPDSCGYVELADVKHILQAVNETEPSESEVDSKLAFYAADTSMTVTWDEFLLLMYDRGPVVGETTATMSATPMTKPKAQHR